jgi:glutathione S-transferase
MLHGYGIKRKDHKPMKLTRRTLLIMAGLLAAACTTWAQAGQDLTQDAYKKLLGQALDEVSKRTPEQARRRIEFGLNLFIAHEAWIRGMTQEALIRAVDAFKEAGVDRIELNPGQYPWLDGDQATIAKYDAVIERIRQHGMKLMLNPQYSTVKHKVDSFAEWRSRAVILYAELARRYRPDTFVVLHEPSTMAARIGQKVKVSDWLGFVRETSRVVKENSPSTRIGAGGLASERQYFDSFVRLPEVEVLTLDIYGVRDLKVYNQMIRASQAAGKPVYIEETWRPPYVQSQPGMTPDTASLKNVGNREFQALDSRWLRVMTAYAQANGLEAITPVWMFALFSYIDGNGDLDDPTYNRAVVEAIMRGERTTTFCTLQEMVRENQFLRR